MSDSLMVIIGIFLAVILMFIFPLMEIGGKNDEISQTVVQVVVSDFVNKVATQGKITSFDYDELVQKLHATGNSYDIQIEAKILDDNPRRATTTGNNSLLGEYKYYSVYTNTILDEIEQNEEYLLKNDDYIVVTVKNTNITMGTQLKNFLYNLIGKDTYTIGTSASALVLNGGDEEATTGPMTANTITYPEKSVKIITQDNVTRPTTLGLKTILNNIDMTQMKSISVNGNSYIVGNTIPNYVVYYDDAKRDYVLDLKLVIELLDMSLEEWNNAEIELLYSQES